MKVILRVQIKKNPWQKLSKSTENKETSLDEEHIPFMELAKWIQEKDRADKLGNDDTSVEDLKSVSEVNSYNEHTEESHVKTSLQAIVGIW